MNLLVNSIKLRPNWFTTFCIRYKEERAFPGGSAVENSPAIQELQEMRVLFQGQEDLLEKCMATHPSILAWRIPWREEPGRLQSIGLQSWTWQKQLSTHTQTGKFYILWCFLVNFLSLKRDSRVYYLELIWQ